MTVLLLSDHISEVGMAMEMRPPLSPESFLLDQEMKSLELSLPLQLWASGSVEWIEALYRCIGTYAHLKAPCKQKTSPALSLLAVFLTARIFVCV